MNKLFLLFVIGFFAILYLSFIFIEPILPKYRDIYYVFACPESDRSSRCYNVQADYDPASCGDLGCEGPYVRGIYINGGHIRFLDSIYDESSKSFESFSDSNTWKIKFDRKVSVKIKDWGYDQQYNPGKIFKELLK